MAKEMEIIVIPNEGDKLEYKEKVDNRGLAKEVVALSNSKGGRIRIGINDDKVVVGTNETTEGIASMIRDSCIPAIIPEITKETDGGKTVINIDLEVGKHPPYRTNQGRYMIRIADRCDDATLDELIDLIVRGPQRGTILLRSKIDDLKNSISASASPCTESGNDRAMEYVNELIELTYQTSSEISKMDTIRVLGELSEMIDFNKKISAHIIWCLPKISTTYLAPNNRTYIPSENIFKKIIDVVENVFRVNTIVAEKTDMIISVLNVFYQIALGCIWAGYENQLIRICEIINQPKKRNKKLDKFLEKTLEKIQKCATEKNVFEPQRWGMLIERIEK